ncbi:MAG: hypothetical protein RR925_04045 [Erysipelotrichaceae bacterium]
MNEIEIKDLIFSYGVLCGKRNSQKQRLKFLRVLKKQFDLLKFQVQIQKKSISFMKMDSKNIYNMYIGDIKNAKIIITSYFDTPIKSLWPSKQLAFETGVSKANVYINMLLSLLFIGSSVGIIYFLLLPQLNNYGFISLWGFLTICIGLISFFVIRQIRGGIINRYNMVRNTSSIVSMIQLASKLTEAERKDIAFAFIDDGTGSELGLKMLNEYIGKNHSTRVYLDSVSNGKNVQCFTNKDLKEAFDKENIHPLLTTKKRYGDILISSGIVIDNNIEIKNANTSKDKILEVSYIDNIVIKLNELIKVL